MGALDLALLLQIGQGARDLHHSMGGAQRQAEPLAGAFQPVLIVRGQGAVLA